METRNLSYFKDMLLMALDEVNILITVPYWSLVSCLLLIPKSCLIVWFTCVFSIYQWSNRDQWSQLLVSLRSVLLTLDQDRIVKSVNMGLLIMFSNFGRIVGRRIYQWFHTGCRYYLRQPQNSIPSEFCFRYLSVRAIKSWTVNTIFLFILETRSRWWDTNPNQDSVSVTCKLWS